MYWMHCTYITGDGGLFWNVHGEDWIQQKTKKCLGGGSYWFAVWSCYFCFDRRTAFSDRCVVSSECSGARALCSSEKKVCFFMGTLVYRPSMKKNWPPIYIFICCFSHVSFLSQCKVLSRSNPKLERERCGQGGGLAGVRGVQKVTVYQPVQSQSPACLGCWSCCCRQSSMLRKVCRRRAAHLRATIIYSRGVRTWQDHIGLSMIVALQRYTPISLLPLFSCAVAINWNFHSLVAD